MRTAAALVIGNELLTGKIQDQNVVVLARALREIGVVLRRVVMVLDEVDTIAAEVKALSASHDVVITSGGVGPTHDDVTIASISRAFGVGVATSPEMEAMLRDYYGDNLREGHLLMARIPEGARLLRTPQSVWPAIVMHNVWILPGVPQIFAYKMPILAQSLGKDRPFVSLAVFTALDEGTIKAHIDRVVAAFPDVEIGSYPTFGEAKYRTKLTFDGIDAARVGDAHRAMIEGIPASEIVPAP